MTMTRSIVTKDEACQTKMASRRSFLRFLIGIPLLSTALIPRQVASKPASRKVLMNDFHVAGLQYYDGIRLVPHLVPGMASFS